MFEPWVFEPFWQAYGGTGRLLGYKNEGRRNLADPFLVSPVAGVSASCMGRRSLCMLGKGTCFHWLREKRFAGSLLFG
jgi:hypothetical protein